MIKKAVIRLQTILEMFREHRLNAASAHAAFFIILSFIPCIVLLLSLLQFTGIYQSVISLLIQSLVPGRMMSFVKEILEEAYDKTAKTISLSALAILWSAGRGMMALTSGLQWIAGIKETRNYFAVRLRATLYTVVLLLSIIVFLLLGVFGNALLELIALRFPVTVYMTKMIVDVKNIFLELYAIVIFTLIYRFMPRNDMKLCHHVPGAIFSSTGWMIYTYAFSLYIDNSKGFSNLYGSLTTIILVMLWLYFGIYITLIGAEVNQLLEKRRNPAVLLKRSENP